MHRRLVTFSEDAPGQAYAQFSNAYASPSPYVFEMPDYALRPNFPREVSCTSALKALMATKASMMGDRSTFDKIVAEEDPQKLKTLGRKVTPFDQELWEVLLKRTAFEIVRQKFEADAGLRQLLLSTTDALICNANQADLIWGAGITVGDPRLQEPDKWPGGNLLGEALMSVRKHFVLENFGGGRL